MLATKKKKNNNKKDQKEAARDLTGDGRGLRVCLPAGCNSPPPSTPQPSHAERDAVDGAGRDPGICFVPADPEDHKGVGGDGGGGVEGFAQPAPRAALVHSDRHLQAHGKRKHDA